MPLTPVDVRTVAFSKPPIGKPGYHEDEAVFCEQVNARAHRVSGRAPVEMLAQERAHLHPVPMHPYTAAFGVSRTVGDQHADGGLPGLLVLGAASAGGPDGVGARGAVSRSWWCTPARAGRPPRAAQAHLDDRGPQPPYVS